MVDAHSNPAFAEQGRIAVDRHQPVLPAEEPPDFRALQLRGHLPVARARTRPVGVEPVVPDLLELPVRDVDEEACDEPGDGIRHVLPPPASPCLQGVAEHAYEIGEDGVPRVSRSAKPVMELALLEIGLLRKVRMRVMAPLHADVLASGIEKRLALRLATR